MKVLFYTNVPSPYRVNFFNELGKYCELTVLFETDSSTERDDTWREYSFKNFKGIIMKGVRTGVDSAFCLEICRYVKKNVYDQIVVTQVASYTAIWAVTYMRMMNIPYAYEGDGGFVSSTTGIKAWLKRWVIGKAQYCFSTSKAFDQYCLAYGAKKDRIYRYSFSSVEQKDLILAVVSKEEKLKYREKLSMQEEYIVLSVGQFIHRKGFDILLQSAKLLPKNIGIYIVGGKATPEYLNMKESWNLQQVHFVDFVKRDELSLYYQAADVFVFPTREDIWGLVVNEAMAKGLPVISTDRCVAALEMVKPGENGEIVPVESVNDLCDAISKILESENLRTQMGKNALEVIKRNYTIENMAKEHIHIFKKEIRKNKK